MTPLKTAMMFGNVTIAELLIEGNASVDVCVYLYLCKCECKSVCECVSECGCHEIVN